MAMKRKKYLPVENLCFGDKILNKFKQIQTVTVRQDNDTYTLFRTSFFNIIHETH